MSAKRRPSAPPASDVAMARAVAAAFPEERPRCERIGRYYERGGVFLSFGAKPVDEADREYARRLAAIDAAEESTPPKT